MENKIKVLIVEDIPTTRKGIVSYINEDEELIVVAEAENSEVALKNIINSEPDIAVIDIELPKPGVDGLKLARLIREKYDNIGIVIHTGHNDVVYFEEAINNGVKGYVYKDESPDELIKAIKQVYNKQPYISPKAQEHIINPFPPKDSRFDKLTPRELEVLKLISEYKTSKEIAKILFISEKTVDSHREHIREKLNLAGSHSLLAFAHENKSKLQ